MSDPLLSIRNHHAPTSGDPPIINVSDRDTYIGYFENEHGEQWVFTSNRTTGEAFLTGGDVGWNNPNPVVGGTVPSLNLSNSERLWLQACCAATHPAVTE